MKRVSLRTETGLSLVEMLAALFILVMTLATVGRVVLTSEANARSALARGDRYEQLRMTVNQIGQDLTFAVAEPSLPAAPGFCCEGGNGYLTVAIYKPKVAADGWQAGWEAGWRGMLQSVHPLRLRYRLVGDHLVREVVEPAAGSQPEVIYSTQILMVGLAEALFTVSGDVVQVRLRTQGDGAGGSGGVEATSSWRIQSAVER